MSANTPDSAEAVKIARQYFHAFADSRGAGTRYGPVHLFKGNLSFYVPLCGRKVKRWNFEGHTDSDFCPRCVKAAMKKQPANH